MRIAFMGTPEFGVSPLEHLLLSGNEVVAVYTQPDKPAGRGRSLVSSPVKKAAARLGLTVLQPASLKLDEVLAQIADIAPDVIVVAAFGQLLPTAILAIPRHGCINIHPSLLPRYRGASPVAAAILAGDKFAGVSIMLMDRGLDTGPVLARAQIPVSGGDTTGTLSAKLSRIGARLLQEVLVYWPRGELSPRPQNEAEATYSDPLTKEEGEIDWRLPAVEIWRRVRAFQPWPGCFSRWQGKQLKIIVAVPRTGSREIDAGRVVALPAGPGKKAGFGIGTGDGILEVLAVQAEGKRVMPAGDFLLGQRQLLGESLG